MSDMEVIPFRPKPIVAQRRPMSGDGLDCHGRSLRPLPSGFNHFCPKSAFGRRAALGPAVEEAADRKKLMADDSKPG
jgi:hypothetical protein